jgi:tetratricopeptide (TPR) repeat protein
VNIVEIGNLSLVILSILCIIILISSASSFDLFTPINNSLFQQAIGQEDDDTSLEKLNKDFQSINEKWKTIFGTADQARELQKGEDQKGEDQKGEDQEEGRTITKEDKDDDRPKFGPKFEELDEISNLLLHAQLNLRQNKFNEAILLFDKALSTDYDKKDYDKETDPYISSLNGKAFALISLGKYQEAISYFDKAISYVNENPSSVGPNLIPLSVAFHNKALALYKLGNYEESIPYFDKALTIDREKWMVVNHKGLALAELGRYEEAIANYDKALAENPRFVDALNNKGNALSALGRFQEANEQYDKALEVISYQESMEKFFPILRIPIDGALDSPVKDSETTIEDNFSGLLSSPLIPNTGQFSQIPPVNYQFSHKLPQGFDHQLGKYSDFSYKYKDLLLVQTTAFVNLHTYNEFNWLQVGLSEKLDNVVIVIQILVNKGINLFEETQYKEANDYFDKALQQNANFAPALFYKHLTLQKLGNHNDAEKFKVKFDSLNSDYSGGRLSDIIFQIPQLPLEEIGFAMK